MRSTDFEDSLQDKVINMHTERIQDRMKKRKPGWRTEEDEKSQKLEVLGWLSGNRLRPRHSWHNHVREQAKSVAYQP